MTSSNEVSASHEMPHTWEEYTANWSDHDQAYNARVEAYEALDITRSDAQAIVDAEEMKHPPGWLESLSDPTEGVK